MQPRKILGFHVQNQIYRGLAFKLATAHRSPVGVFLMSLGLRVHASGILSSGARLRAYQILAI